MRLIDADALKKAIDKYAQMTNENVQFSYNAILAIIDNAPTVDTTCPNCDSGYAQGYSDGYLKGKEERPQGECIPVKDLINFIHTCREELFEKMKDYHQKEFEIRDSMLTNFEQIIKLASSKYKADMRGGRE